MSDWIVMSSTNVLKGSQRCFDTNATGLTEDQAEVEAKRRNKVEREAGNRGTKWFACQDPSAFLKRMGLDLSTITGSSE